MFLSLKIHKANIQFWGIFVLTFLCFIALFFLLPDTAFGQNNGNPADAVANGGSGINGQPEGAGTGGLGSSGWFDWFGIGDKIKGVIYTLATVIGMAVVSFGGLLLDLSIRYAVLEMGSLLSAKESLGIGILEIWAVVRDILNILFIFGLIYIGISTILDSHKSETQRTLAYLIIAALFVNFSLYVTQVVIDFTNILAIQVYNQIIEGGSLSQGFSGTTVPLDANSISGAFLNVAGLSSFFGANGDVLKNLDFPGVVFYSIFMMVFLIIAGIVFAMGAVLLITRFAVLILYMIFSPFMFAGWIFPALGHASEEWWNWKGLLKQALFAPAFLFMLYLSLVVLQRLQGAILKTPGQFSNMVASGTAAVDSFSMVMFFSLMIVFLFASIKIATSMGVLGAKGAQSMMDSVKKRMLVTAGGATMGMAARAGRATVGRYAYEKAESDSMKDWASRSLVGRAVWSAAKYGGDASFDARKVGGLGKTTGLGEGAKGGYKSIKEDIEKKEKEFAKSLGEIEDDDAQVSFLIQQKESYERKIHHEKQLRDKVRATDEDQAELDELKVEKEAIDPNDKNAKKENARKIAAVEKRIRDDIEKRKGNITKVIEQAEKDLKKQEEIIKQEKARRQVGGYVDAKTSPATAQRYADAERALKDAQKRFDEAGGPAGKAAAAKIIKAQNKIIKDLKHEAKVQAGELGYAGTLEQKGTVATMKSWATGRLASQDRAAGKAVRKQFSKGHAKDEAHKHEDKGHKADKHDDHGGGGHDNHGKAAAHH